MPNAKYESPYDGANEMLLVDDVDNKNYLTGLFNAMYDELPAPKPKKWSEWNLRRKNDFRNGKVDSSPMGRKRCQWFIPICQ